MAAHYSPLNSLFYRCLIAMNLDTFNHRFNAKIARFLALAMASTAVTISIEIWPELVVIKWVALAIGVLMLAFVFGSSWLLIAQMPWRNYNTSGELLETAVQFTFLIAAVIVGAWIA